jgi:hypothetical protein
MKLFVAFLSIVLISILLFMLIRTKEKTNYKYIITYNYSRYSCEDFTNEFEYLPGNATIRYVNERGDSVYRSGTFYIEQNKK